jgi:hypothetical protein
MIEFPDRMQIRIGDDANGQAIFEPLVISEMDASKVPFVFGECAGTKVRDTTAYDKDDKTKVDPAGTITKRRWYLQHNLKSGNFQSGRGKRIDTNLKALLILCVETGMKQSEVVKWTRKDIGAHFKKIGLDIESEEKRISDEKKRRAAVMATAKLNVLETPEDVESDENAEDESEVSE